MHVLCHVTIYLKESIFPMKTFSRLFLFVSCFWLFSCAASTDAVITGFVQATETDENDNPVDIYLFDGKDEYRFSESKAHEQLFDLVDRKVTITGTVSDWGGKKTISVDEYKVVD